MKAYKILQTEKEKVDDIRLELELIKHNFHDKSEVSESDSSAELDIIKIEELVELKIIDKEIAFQPPLRNKRIIQEKPLNNSKKLTLKT